MCTSKIVHALALERAQHALSQMAALTYCMDSDAIDVKAVEIRYINDLVERLQSDLSFLNETYDSNNYKIRA